MSAPSERRAVGVFGGEQGPRLTAALELAFPVEFLPRGSGELRGLDAVVDLGGGEVARAGARAGLPSLHLAAAESEQLAGPAQIRLTRAESLDQRLAGAVLLDPHAASAAAPAPPAGAAVLASRGATPLWWAAGPFHGAALAPAELGNAEALRDRLGAERCLALLPLVHFLREVCAEIAWKPPSPRAAFVFDDPNLHWPTYGYVDLPALSRHAREHGYHAALATVPRDARWAHPSALRAVEESLGAISLTVHGNDHDGGELGRAGTTTAAIALAAQALRRVARFEARTGQPIERVMVPPHEKCSAATVEALRRCGFEAISMTLPYPWLGRPPSAWLARPAEADALVGWRPLERTAGLPAILRHPLACRSAAELRLRAFLDQPLVLYGHHGDLAAGLDALAEAQAEVATIAQETTWASLATISRGSYETRLEGEVLAVRPLGNRLDVEVPAGVSTLRFEPPAAAGSPAPEVLVDGRPVAYGEAVAAPARSNVAVTLGPTPIEVAEVGAPPRRPLALARRLANESRDRLAPLLAR